MMLYLCSENTDPLPSSRMKVINLHAARTPLMGRRFRYKRVVSTPEWTRHKARNVASERVLTNNY